MAKCPSCGAPVDANQKKCPYCGAKIDTPTTAPVTTAQDEVNVDDSEEDELDEMNRSQLKEYIKEMEYTVKVTKSMSDEDIRREIRREQAVLDRILEQNDDDENEGCGSKIKGCFLELIWWIVGVVVMGLIGGIIAVIID